MSHNICVVGAGVIGLSSACRIQENIDDVTVTIVAELVSPMTTSDGAGGFWQPFLMGDTPTHKLRQWGSDTFNHLMSLSLSPAAHSQGITRLRGVQLNNHEVPDPFWSDIVMDFRHVTQAELNQFPKHRSGWKYTTVCCEGRKYLPWLLTRFKEKGGKLIRKKLNNFDELYEDYDVIVNCTGLAARELCGDKHIVPIKGQLIKVEAPWMKNFLLDDDNSLYILINTDCVILGGTHEEGEENLEIDRVQRERIWSGCCQLMPSLKDARILRDWAGLRPSRTSVRLETETIQFNNRIRKIVHNYGHGGGGITFHWGCAGEAANLVQQAIAESIKTKL